MMEQNIVFVENKAGSLKKVTKILAENAIDIYGFACFDTPEFAIFRMVCSDPHKAETVLSENGYMNRITNVIVVNIKDEVGTLDELLDVLAQSNVSLNYIYTSFHRQNLIPVVILHSEEISETESVLRGNGFSVLSHVDELKQ
jgi:hypothetical protein